MVIRTIKLTSLFVNTENYRFEPLSSQKEGYATDAEIEAIDQRVVDLVAECEKFAEESPFPDLSVMYDVVYDQKDYPFLPHKL
jgi:TPP-dependent pyruvate/acetoin dehydrogenase alpha subunit